jgi:hypothetical protein
MRKIPIRPGGCLLTPLMRARMAIRQAIEGRPGNTFKFDQLTVSQKSRANFAFKGVGNRPNVVNGQPLGGERVQITGVFNSLKGEFTKYSEKVLAKLREFKAG